MRFGKRIVEWSITRPGSLTGLMLASAGLLIALAAIPTLFPGSIPLLEPLAVDTDPENMLAHDEPARVFHEQTKKTFALYDMVVLGVVNEEGVYNPQTLEKVHRLTEKAKTLPGVVAQEVLSISTVDNVEGGGAGVVRFEWMMAEPPDSKEAAQALQQKVMRIPFLKDTIASADGKALAIFIPLESKDKAHDVAVALEKEVAALGSWTETFHITGLPVAEDTFGYEMFIQMAISAPVAMLVIFLLMFVFFRKLVVIVSPMIVAMVCSLSTMALLVISGNTVHIMSSMIPIFIMPIAVLDAIHIISEFFDLYQKTGRDRGRTIRLVMDELFTPMLFTSLTTAAGFASLALTPIPPVQVFGVFVAVGVLLAWFWTVTFVPAFTMFISEAQLASFGMSDEAAKETPLERILRTVGRFTVARAKVLLLLVVGVGVLSAYGISLININDNPTKWFEPKHPIRVADRVMNRHFAGTYEAYLTLEAKVEPLDAAQVQTAIATRKKALSEVFSEVEQRLEARAAIAPLDALEAVDATLRAKRPGASGERLAGLVTASDLLAPLFDEAEDPDAGGFDPKQRFSTAAAAALKSLDALEAKASAQTVTGPALQAALAEAAEGPALVLVQELAQRGQVFKTPEALRYLESLQEAMGKVDVVGKSNALPDIVKTVHRDLVSGKEEDYRIPSNRAVVAQTLDQFQSSHRKTDLWHFVTPEYDQAAVWIQLKSGDNRDMERTVRAAEQFFIDHPPPMPMGPPRWSGLTYINVIWQDKMVSGMLDAFLGSFVVVLLMMVFLFRSLLWGLLSMVPLTITVAMIYGILGLVGKDYDMPVAVLSSLSLGLAIDYAIHFLARSRAARARHDDWESANIAVFGEPARAIGRNAIVVGVGFLPLLLAPLVPYQTVGTLIAAILLSAGAATLLILPALITVLQRWLFKKGATL